MDRQYKTVAEMKRKKVIPGAIRFAAGTLRAVFQPSQFQIKRGYIHRDSVMLHDDNDLRDEYQKEVYEAAAAVARDNNLHSVLDVGCGSGYKLVTSLGDFAIAGVDMPSVIEHNRIRYPDRKWITMDEFIPHQLRADLIICADVIEHVADPAEFMRSLLEVRDWQYLVISTPERDVKRGWYHFGPPPNVHHFREWNREEFSQFLAEFVVVEKCSVINKVQGTQMAVCSRRP
jgi:SAM-dependent methyltransferase